MQSILVDPPDFPGVLTGRDTQNRDDQSTADSRLCVAFRNICGKRAKAGGIEPRSNLRSKEPRRYLREESTDRWDNTWDEVRVLVPTEA